MKECNTIISVIICTFNRGDLLKVTLESLVAQTVDRSLYEIVVVDNNSSDNTRAVVDSYARRFPNIRYLFEPQQGIAYARNCGWRGSQSKYIAYTDDDVKVPENWLELTLQYFKSIKPAIIALGGPARHYSICRIPGWLKKDYDKLVWGPKPRFLKPGESFYTLNVIIKREILESVNGFDTSLGHKGNYFASSEDTHLFEEIWKRYKNPAIYYSPDLYIYHFIPHYMLTIQYELRQAFAQGQMMIKINSPRSISERLRVIRSSGTLFMKLVVRSLIKRIQFSGGDAWMHRWGVAIARELGRMAGACGILINIRRRY